MSKGANLESDRCRDGNQGMTRPTLNPTSDVMFSQEAEWASDVLHIYNDNYLGIRSAASALPGQKLVLPNNDWHYQRHLIEAVDLIRQSGAQRLVFHGMSNAVYETAIASNRTLRKAQLFGVWHGGPSQWVSHQEAVQFERFLALDYQSIYARAHIMQPGCNMLLRNPCPVLLVNSAPKSVIRTEPSTSRAALVPAPPSPHKNLYGNLCAGELSANLDEVMHYALLSPEPMLLQKARHHSYKGPVAHQQLMQRACVVLNGSTMDCHPMVDLEAAAVGRPSVHMDFQLGVLDGHPLTKLATIADSASIGSILETLDRLLDHHAAELYEMSLDYASAMTNESIDRMEIFLYG